VRVPPVLSAVKTKFKYCHWLFQGLTGSKPVSPLLLTLLLCGGGALAQDGYWINSSGGSWADAANWDVANGVASGADSTAYFGFSREASISPTSTFTLDGAQTVGHLCFTTHGGASTWNITPGVGGLLTLDSTFGLSEITVTSPSLQVALNALVAGTGGVEKDGPGILVLGGQNTYTGKTLVTGGGLTVNGSIGTGRVQIGNATFSGTGVVMGPVVVGPGGMLSLGNPGGPLTINNSLVLLPGSITSVSIYPGNTGSPAVQGLSSITYGGTLLVQNLVGALSVGQTFSIFGSASASGSFSQISPPPGPGLAWQFDAATGQITVVPAAFQPAFFSINLSGKNLIVQVIGGSPGLNGYLISTTDLGLPMTAWTQVSENVFDASGGFTSTIDTSADAAGQRYFAVLVVAPR
jgi:autotransporter-associated beta strand protein